MHRLMNIDYFNSILFNIENWSRMDGVADQIDQLLEERHRHAATSEDDFLVQNREEPD